MDKRQRGLKQIVKTANKRDLRFIISIQSQIIKRQKGELNELRCNDISYRSNKQDVQHEGIEDEAIPGVSTSNQSNRTGTKGRLY